RRIARIAAPPEIFNTGPGRPVHVSRFHRRLDRAPDCDQPEWQGLVARQRFQRYEEVYLRLHDRPRRKSAVTSISTMAVRRIGAATPGVQGESVGEAVDRSHAVTTARPTHAIHWAALAIRSSLVPDPTRARELLGWSAVRSDLATIIGDACRWHR